MAEFFKAIPISELKEGQGRCAIINDQRIAVFLHAGQYSAIDDACTHANASLSEGFLHDGCVSCPWHGADFDLKSGEAKTAPAFERVQTYKVRVVDDMLEVEMP